MQRLNLTKSRATANVPAKIAMPHSYHFSRSTDQLCWENEIMSPWKYQYQLLNLRLLLEICIMHKAALNLCSQNCWFCQVKKVKAIHLIFTNWESKTMTLLTLTRSGLVRLEKHLYKMSANIWTSRWMVFWWVGSWLTPWRSNWGATTGHQVISPPLGRSFTAGVKMNNSCSWSR